MFNPGLPGEHDSPISTSQVLGPQIAPHRRFRTLAPNLDYLGYAICIAEPVRGRFVVHWCPWILHNLWEMAHSGDSDLVDEVE